jgi:hypothetical protein
MDVCLNSLKDMIQLMDLDVLDVYKDFSFVMMDYAMLLIV